MNIVVDVVAAEKNHVTICHVPDLEKFNINNTQQLCNTIVSLIDHYELQNNET